MACSSFELDNSDLSRPRSPSVTVPTRSSLLDLSFRGPSPASTTGWREGRWSDWNVRVGPKTYRLHAFTLARASLFFESHMNVSQQTGSDRTESDLSEVLPEACYDAFEDALDFVYSDNQAAFEVPLSRALLLLKIADILGIPKLFEVTRAKVVSEVEDSAPLLLEQHCRFYIPGTTDNEALQNVHEHSVALVIERFQLYLVEKEYQCALMHLPQDILVDILSSDDLAVASEDVVFDFVVGILSLPHYVDEANPEVAQSLWQCVRWVHLGSAKFAEVLENRPRLLNAEQTIQALADRVAQAGPTPSLPGNDGVMDKLVAPKLRRRTVRPPEIPPPSSIDIDFCMHFGHAGRYSLGQPLRSEPVRLGDLVLRVLVFPCGTKTGVAHGSLSVFLEAVPQPHWPPDWEFAQIKYSIVCFRWPAVNGDRRLGKRKTDTWTFRSSKLDRGWHDFLQPGEVQKYLSPMGFLLLRGSIEPSCLSRTFLAANDPGNAGESHGAPAAVAAGLAI